MNPTMYKTTSNALALLLTLTACSSTPRQVTLRDGDGNYVTTADYEAMDRTDFVSAINAGLADFDEQISDLRQRANKLGGSSLKEFADCEVELREKRTDVINQLTIAESSLNADYPSERSSTVEAYAELREELTEAQKDVLDRS